MTSDPAHVGNFYVGCPECGETIAVPVKATIDGNAELGQQLVCDPDLTDVWAHAWTHETGQS